MAFVGEEQQFGGHLLRLQCGEQLQALADRNAVIEFAVDDERRGLEIGSASGRRPLFVDLRGLPGMAFELPGGEPQFLGFTAHAGEIIDPGVGDEGLEAVRMA